MIAFAACGIAGLILLAVTLTRGELLDARDVADLGISTTTIATALIAAGLTGVLTCALNPAPWLPLLVAATAGFAAACTAQTIRDHHAETDTP